MENKYLEAYLHIYQWLEDDNVGTYAWENDIKELLKNIKELVDKETPMKVVFESNGSAIKSARCPICNGLIHFGFETYCCYCGTKLSWE